MDVRTFVAQTIEQVLTAVVDAQQTAKSLNAEVNPAIGLIASGQDRPASLAGYTRDNYAIYTIDFDIAVTTGTAITGKSATLQVAPMSAASGKSSQTRDENVSRVRFSVPVTLPIDAEIDGRRKAEKAAEAAEFHGRRR